MIHTTIDPVLMAIADQQREELGPIFCDAAGAAFAQAHPTEESLPDWWQQDAETREMQKDVAVHLFALGMQAMVAARDADSDVVAPVEPLPSGCQFTQAAQGTGNPFAGWTIQPWRGGHLWASKDGERNALVGTCATHGWLVWLPTGTDEFDRGPETCDEGRTLAEKALVEAGADIPWFKP